MSLTDHSLSLTRGALRIKDFEFDAQHIERRVYDDAIKQLLRIVHREKLIKATPPCLKGLVESHLAFDEANIRRALTTLESFCSIQHEHLDKFVGFRDVASNTEFRLHFPTRRTRSIWSKSVKSRNSVGFFGLRPRLHQLDPEKDHLWYWRCCKIDELIVDLLNPTVVTAYVTGQSQPGKFEKNMFDSLVK